MKSTTQLEALAEQFSHWRATREKKGKTPSHLIKAVLELIGDYPKYKIAQVLGISSSTLKRWEHQFAPTLIENDFVEITDVGTPPIPETQALPDFPWFDPNLEGKELVSKLLCSV